MPNIVIEGEYNELFVDGEFIEGYVWCYAVEINTEHMKSNRPYVSLTNNKEDISETFTSQFQMEKFMRDYLDEQES